MISTKNNGVIEVYGNEKMSFSKFLDAKSEKTVNLERILGIGGEGIVLKKGMDVALKFVEFEKNDDEDFLEPEKEDKVGYYGGITYYNPYGKQKLVRSQYFERLKKLGDFKAATWVRDPYSRPYIDFGISKIHQNYHYVIG